MIIPIGLIVFIQCCHVVEPDEAEEILLVYKYRIKTHSENESSQELVDRLMRDLHPTQIVTTKHTIQVVVDRSFNRYNRDGSKVGARVATLGGQQGWSISPSVVFPTTPSNFDRPKGSTTYERED